MSVRQVDQFLEQWQMEAKDLHRRLILAPTPRERERWHAIWLLAQGWTASGTAQALGRDPHTIGPLRQDYEYRREGTRNLFLACEPLAGWREVAVTERRTMQDFARRMRWLADEAYPEAEVVRVVLDNLNTHRPEYPSPGIAVRDFPG